MTCRELADFILDFLSGELSPDVQAEFEKHLGLCPNCRRYLAIYKDSVAIGRHAFDEGDEAIPATMPEELVAAVLAALRRG